MAVADKPVGNFMITRIIIHANYLQNVVNAIMRNGLLHNPATSISRQNLVKLAFRLSALRNHRKHCAAVFSFARVA